MWPRDEGHFKVGVGSGPIDNAALRAFREKVLRWGRAHVREFPWRPPHLKQHAPGVLDPYAVWVSEVMLQQTQTTRVCEYFPRFLARFPTVASLARAPRRAVLAAWSGLGYNRRALLLHEAAKMVMAQWGGALPSEKEALRALPGVGAYTAGAVRVFAFNLPEVLLETNIRTVFLHHFFPDRDAVPDAALLPYIEASMSRRKPRVWYTALMDYGAHLKRGGVRLNCRSRHYRPAPAFRGSLREVRGAALRLLVRRARTPLREEEVCAALPFPRPRVRAALRALVREGFVTHRGGGYVVRE